MLYTFHYCCPFPIEIESCGTARRTCLLLLLCTALGGVWILEQPSGSLLPFYPAFREVMQSIFETGGIQAVRALVWLHVYRNH